MKPDTVYKGALNATLQLLGNGEFAAGLPSENQLRGQIAETLVLSPRTVTTHVHHILQKLQAPNRTEAAVLAERYGLSP